MGQQAVAQIKVQRVGIGQDQMFGILRGKRHGIRRVWHGQGAGVGRDGFGKAVKAHIDPSDCEVGQGGQSVDQRPAHMPRAPDPKLALRAGDGFDEPALQKLRLRQLCLCCALWPAGA